MDHTETTPSSQSTDEVLDRFKRDQRAGVDDTTVAGSTQPRGRLKIFFGMSPGVGKTYAMLAAAQRLAAQGVDVAVGVVETHGRTETEQLLLGLDIIPRVKVDYQGSAGVGATLHEFDVDTAMRRRPNILLVDELAHSNAPGSPSGRAKRWQDVEACLAAGVNVFTTLNVQHLESINDVVAQITGVKVTETVPDRVFDEADEIELVDLPPDALHERLKAGKVYLGENAARAVDPSDGFFRKGNLTALRELALRRTAAWVDSEMRRYKQDRGIRAVWPAGERIVVAVSPSPMSGKLVRAAKRMAAGLHADLIAVYVETPRTSSLSAADRQRLDTNMRLAESLGASTHTLAGENAARELIAFARSRNVGRVVVGKTARARWKEALFGSFIDNLIRESGDIDIYVVRGDETIPPAASAVQTIGLNGRHAAKPPARLAWELAASACLVVACALIGLAFYRPPDLSEESLILLSSVVISALWFGRVASIFASIMAVLAFNYFFTEPRFTLNINDTGYIFTFAVMLAVGIVVGTLAARAREQRLRAWSRERATAAQHALARELAAARDAQSIAAIVARSAHDLLQADAVVCLPTPYIRDGGTPHTRLLDVAAAAGPGGPDWHSGEGEDPTRERAVARWVLDHRSPAGYGTSTLPSAKGRYVPLIGSNATFGVLGIRAHTRTGIDILDSAQLATLDSIASQAASALERVTLAESEQRARVNAERERLRSALLSSVSHDLRTPLASITGAASTLQQTDPSQNLAVQDHATIDQTTRISLLQTIVDESSRLNDIIANLVFATRLESGSVDLRREWTTVEEIVGVGLSRHRSSLATRPFRVQVPTDLPMIRVDNAMLPQVVHNLIENALRYTTAGTALGISAWTSETSVVIKVWDEGAGLADDESSKVFERFYRGRASKSAGVSSSSPTSTGMGLGLTICEGIIRAHGGRIWAEPNTPRPPHGVAFLFSLPVEHPQPALPSMEDVPEIHAKAANPAAIDNPQIGRSAP
ncbi:MAG: sensor histidine kinase KdpD [Phycisphaerales bacterium]|nr:sensor histidine kinase KdpD [Phycisphaerales bacterium]